MKKKIATVALVVMIFSAVGISTVQAVDIECLIKLANCLDRVERWYDECRRTREESACFYEYYQKVMDCHDTYRCL